MIRAVSPGIGSPRGRPHRALRVLIASMVFLAWMALPVASAAQPQDSVPPKDAAQKEDSGVRWDGTSLRFGDVLRLDPRVRVQADFVLDTDSEVLTDTFYWGSRRLGVEGELFNRLTFQVEKAFRNDDDEDVGLTEWRDVYADFRFGRALRVRGGRFKLPFSLERNTSRDELDFLQRATAVRTISPPRDTGVMVHGELIDRTLQYEVGVFRRADGLTLPNDIDTNFWEPLGSTFAGRVIVKPIRNSDTGLTRDLHFGVGLVRNTMPEGLYSVVGRTFDSERFSERFHVNGQRTRLGVEGLWDARRVILKGELLQLTDQRAQQSVTNEDLSDMVASGSYITAVVRVLGEPGRQGPAVDVAARFDRVSFGSKNDSEDPFSNPRADNIAPLAKNTWTFGGTWTVHRWIRVQGNLIREDLVDTLDVWDVPTSSLWTTVVRLQFAL